MKRRAVSVLVLLLAVAGRAHAEPHGNEPAAAQALFYGARALMQQGRYAEACPKLEESMRLDAGIGTQFNLADCNEHIGKTATAWAGFVDVAAAAHASHQAERETVARKRAQALEARVPRLVIEASGVPAGTEVARDGVALAPSSYGKAVPVDPGTHRITATAPGKQTWQTSIRVAEATVARVTVPRDLPALATSEATAPAPQPVASGAVTTITSAPSAPSVLSAPETTFPPPVVESSISTQRVAGWVLMGMGVVGAGVGVGFGLTSIGDRNASRSHCSGDRCDAEGVRLRDDAIRHGNIATISVIAGAAAIAGGLVLVLTAPRAVESPERAARLRAVPNVARGGGGLLLEGVFQ